MTRTLRLMVLALSAGLGACCISTVAPEGADGGASSTGAAATGGSGTTGAATTGGGTTGGGTTSAGTTGGTTGPSDVGEIAFEKIFAPEPGGSSQTTYSVGAFFGSSLPPSSFGCSGGVVSGSCCYIAGAGAPGGGLPTSSLSAGSIPVSDGSSALGTLAYSGSNYTPLFSCGFGVTQGCDSALTWSGGDILSAAAAGATVPAFTATTIAAADLANVQPSFSNPPVTIPSSADWVVSWTPGTGAAATAQMTLTIALSTCALPPNNVADGVISCQAPDAAGTLTVSKSLLSHFHSGDFGALSLARTIQTTAHAGAVPVTLQTQYLLETIADVDQSCSPAP